MSVKPPIVKNLGLTDYEPVWRAMQQLTDSRHKKTMDELWLTEHNPVYTQGLNGRKEHLLKTADIPIIQTDRGGQVTYHGPGQLIVYCLLNLTRLGLGIRQLVTAIEQAVIDLLSEYDIDAHSRRDAPGVYIEGAKIAALGLRVRKDCCYHGLSLNLDMDLAPFSGIHPCGLQGLKVTRFADHVKSWNKQQIGNRICFHLIKSIGYEQQK